MREVNYWRFRTTEEKEVWRTFQKMWDEVPESARRHFQSTAEAIDRMRIARGEAPINNLRCRTILRGSLRNT